jgi:membrane protease YdiL (CAAX protease family)
MTIYYFRAANLRLMPLKAIWQNNTPYSKFLISVGVILISAIFFTIVSVILATSVYGVSILELPKIIEDFDNPLTIEMLKLIQTVSTIGTFIIPAILLAYFFSTQPAAYLGLDKKALPGSFILIVVLMVVALPFINFLGELNSHMKLPEGLSGLEKWMKDAEDKAALVMEKFLVMNSAKDFIYAFVMIALLPAIGEELMFRGVVQRIFSEWFKNVNTAIFVSAILFSAMHMQFYGFVPRMLLGLLLGYLYVWSGSLWLPILAHLVNNGAAVIFYYFYQNGKISFNPDEIGTQNDYAAILISAFLVAGILVTVYRLEKKKKSLVIGH